MARAAKTGKPKGQPDTKGKRRRSMADEVRDSRLPANTGRGKPGTGRPDDDETYRGSKQGPK